MNTLPDDVLCRCLARVPMADRVPAERVCKGWRTAFASKAYKVARNACAEPLLFVCGGRCGTPATAITKCCVLDVSLRCVAQLESHHSYDASAASIPGLGVLLLGGGDEAAEWGRPSPLPRDKAARVHDLTPGSSWRKWGDLPTSCDRVSICPLGESVYVQCGTQYSEEGGRGGPGPNFWARAHLGPGPSAY